MATTTAKIAGGSTVNNGGTIVNAGNVPAGSPITKVIDVNDLNTGSEYGSKVVSQAATGGGFSDPHGVRVARAGSSGVLAYFPTREERNFLIRAAGDTGAGKINNVSSTVLTTPGGVNTGGSIHELASTRRIGSYATASFNVLAMPSSGVVPGRTKGTGAGSLSTYVEIDGTTPASDEAATPTRSVPGELTYMFGSITPKQDNYKAKDSYES
jgi:hypothetical protein